MQSLNLKDLQSPLGLWETAAEMKWEVEVITVLSKVLLGMYWSTSFKYSEEERRVISGVFFFLLLSCGLELLQKPKRFLLKVVFGGTLLQIAASKGKLPTKTEYVFLLNEFLPMHCVCLIKSSSFSEDT